MAWGNKIVEKKDIVIGIDPGTNTGVAVWDSKLKCFARVETMAIHKAMQVVLGFHAQRASFRVRMEDARKRTWFGNSGPEKWKGAGSIARDCSIWEDFFKDMGIEYELVHPKDIKTKTKAEYFARIAKWKGRTSEHARDAGMMVIGS